MFSAFFGHNAAGGRLQQSTFTGHLFILGAPDDFGIVYHPANWHKFRIWDVVHLQINDGGAEAGKELLSFVPVVDWRLYS